MMNLTYTGPHDGVDVHLPSGLVVTVRRHGAPIEVADAFGRSLLKQEGNWKAVKAEKTETADKPQKGDDGS